MSNKTENKDNEIKIDNKKEQANNMASVKKTSAASAVVLFLFALAKAFFPGNAPDDQIKPPVDTPYVQEINQEDSVDNNDLGITIEYTFRTEKYMNEHFEKHGGDFNYMTAKEYEQGASAVVNNPKALHKIEAEDGDDVYYLESTNEFVIVSTDGYIRTYFKPNDGIKYFNRQ